MKTQYWVVKRDMTLSGRKVTKGQLVRPSGAVNDHIIFADSGHYTCRYHGNDPLLCGTDGCPEQFDYLGNLARHREIVHAPERDGRAQAMLQRAHAEREAEAAGESIGGLRIIDEKAGPGGRVPYVKHPATV